jgi:hypothetical protein
MARDFFPEEAIKRTMDWVVDTILIPHFMSLGLNASGEWVANVKTRVEGQEGIISGRQYSEQLVYGRRPGAMPPIAPLERWAQVKLGLSGTEARSAAFAIAKKIAKEGTEIYKEGGTDLIEILSTPDTQQRIAQYLAQQMQAEVKLYLEREIMSV